MTVLVLHTFEVALRLLALVGVVLFVVAERRQRDAELGAFLREVHGLSQAQAQALGAIVSRFADEVIGQLIGLSESSERSAGQLGKIGNEILAANVELERLSRAVETIAGPQRAGRGGGTKGEAPPPGVSGAARNVSTMQKIPLLSANRNEVVVLQGEWTGEDTFEVWGCNSASKAIARADAELLSRKFGFSAVLKDVEGEFVRLDFQWTGDAPLLIHMRRDSGPMSWADVSPYLPGNASPVLGLVAAAAYSDGVPTLRLAPGRSKES